MMMGLLAGLMLTGEAAATPTPAGHVLVWADEFDHEGLPDPSRWTYDASRNREGWHNNEAQYYAVARPENAHVENGRLVLTARRETLADAPDWGGQTYTSARLLSTAPGWTYGLIEVRAKLPCARGTWPAIWMLPVQPSGWPLGGEIDIMEHVGHAPGAVHGTVHTQAYNHINKTERGGSIQIDDACQSFHRYQVQWRPEAVTFMVDDQPYYSFANDGAGAPETWPFDKPFRLILNIAVGGDWGGAQGIDDDALPQTMEVDYVRVFQPIPH